MLSTAKNTFNISSTCFTRMISSCLLPNPINEPISFYKPGSLERSELITELKNLRSNIKRNIGPVINGIDKSNESKSSIDLVFPSDNNIIYAKVYETSKNLAEEAIKGALKAKKGWEKLPLHERASVFLKAADLISTKYRAKVMAATMLGQSKTVYQAEIDCIDELCDFLRFNCKYAEEIYQMQPKIHSKGIYNSIDYRPLDGFVYAVSPFNFTAIGANLACAPAILGNVVIWKPAEMASYSNKLVFDILREAGLPDGVIQFLPGRGQEISEAVFSHSDLSAIHFTGSTAVFDTFWKTIGTNIDRYSTYPKIVGETGGKNFHFVHESADFETVINQTIRGAFEFQGQKCSATSRMYVPSKMLNQYVERLVDIAKTIKMGQPDDFDSFMAAVIDERAFNKIDSFINKIKQSKEAKIVFGGECDNSKGYFISPTICVTESTDFVTFKEEIFGPVLTIYGYDEENIDSVLESVVNVTKYGLTGSIFAKDRYFINKASEILRYASGNLYINDKSTGAVVGQQPFGGSRKSGTNDKAGSILNMFRWISPRTVKENYLPLDDYNYPISSSLSN